MSALNVVHNTVVILRGGVVNRTYGTHKSLPVYIYLFLLLILRGTIVDRTIYCW